ncbi:hypothetical protein KBB27_00260 [Patescibacteria group bacterium]|nr:hypothetical protein [Patescibacteria group bacterium]
MAINFSEKNLQVIVDRLFKGVFIPHIQAYDSLENHYTGGEATEISSDLLKIRLLNTLKRFIEGHPNHPYIDDVDITCALAEWADDTVEQFSLNDDGIRAIHSIVSEIEERRIKEILTKFEQEGCEGPKEGGTVLLFKKR